MKTQNATAPAITTGPWSFERHNPKLFKVESTTARRVICDFYGNNAEDEANARLIAAAPDLLAALQNLSRAVADAGKEGTRGNLARAEEQARDAITRATAP